MEDGFYLYTVPINEKYRSMVTNFFEIVSDHIISFGISSTLISNISYPFLYNNGKSQRIYVVNKSSIYDYLSTINKVLSSFKSIDNHIVVKMALNHGEVFHNIYRPTLSENVCNAVKCKIFHNKPERSYYTDLPIERGREYLFYLNQIGLIIDDLNKAAKTIYFCKENYNVYGALLRNIIILSCTEIDSMMSNILKKNGYLKNRYTTKDYCKLIDIMKVDEYKLKLVNYLDLEDLQPFYGWNEKKSTSSLVWYDAYNKIKHDWEHNLEKASLENAIKSVAALVILLVAQYGYRNEDWDNLLGSIFMIVNEPVWDLSEFYVPPISSETTLDWIDVRHPKLCVAH